MSKSPRSQFLFDERQKRLEHPARLRDFRLWDGAMDELALCTNTANEVIAWMKDPENKPEPDILAMLGAWAKASEFLKMLDGKMPVEFDEKTAEELDLYSLEKIDDELSEVNGFFMATEEYNAQLYQQAINRQLHARIEKWRETASRPASSFEYDYDEVWDACNERDELEYIRAAISVIQMSEDVETRQPLLPEYLPSSLQNQILPLFWLLLQLPVDTS